MSNLQDKLIARVSAATTTNKVALLALMVTAAVYVSPVVHADIGATHTSLVSEFASFNTPGVVDGRVEAIAVDGDKVFVGGNFTQIVDPFSDEIIDQPYLFAYSKSTGNIIREFDPDLNNRVYALETTGEGTGIFAAGVFNIINGESNRRGIVKIDDNGDRVPGFGARADALIRSLVRLDDVLYMGGNFSSISNTPVENLAAIDTTTGQVLPQIDLDFDGAMSTRRIDGVQGIDDIDITSDGRLMIVVGNFSLIDGISRPRLALIELEGQAAVSTWNTDIFDDQCGGFRPNQILGIDVAPDDSYFITGSSGGRQNLNPACDTMLRFELDDLSNTAAQPTWINYTGGDSIFEVVATDHAIYAGGHFRWVNNYNSLDSNSSGPASAARLGLAAFDPLNGLTLRSWQADRNPRGAGTFALIAEPEGLYIGDDTDFLNGTEHKKLKFLPISNETITRPVEPSLPTTILTDNGLGTSGLNASSFDGQSIGASEQVGNSNTEFTASTAAMYVGGQLYYTDIWGDMYVRTITQETSGTAVEVDLLDLAEEHWAVSEVSAMFFDYGWSRVYYTVENDPNLYYRAFSPAETYFGDVESIAEQQGDIDWANVTSMDVIDGFLYFTLADEYLYRALIDGASVISGTTEAVSGPALDGRYWENDLMAFSNEGAVIGHNNVSNEIVFESSGSSEGTGRFRRFEFEANEGEAVVLKLEWLDPEAQLRIFVRDENNNLLGSDVTAASSAKYLTIPAGDGGTYTAAILVAQGSSAYTLTVNPTDGAPEALADFEFTANGSADSGSWQVFQFEVAAGDLVDAQLLWDDPGAQLNMFLRDETRSSVVRITDGRSSPSVASTIAANGGTWSVGVKIKSGSTNYSVLVDTSQ